MSKKNEQRYTPLGDMFEPDTGRYPNPTREPRHKRFGRFIGSTVMVSLIVSGFVTAPAITAGSAAKVSVAQWDALLPAGMSFELQLPSRSYMYDKDGKKFAEFHTENRIPVTLNEINPIMVNALLAVEDDRFYSHGPIDFKGTTRALVTNLTTGSQQGGSTLSQQLVKNMLQQQAVTKEAQHKAVESSVTRKVKELRIAVELEKTWSKDRILTEYLNTVNFGNGAYGVYAASKFYFAKKPVNLNAAESALLVGMLKSPTNFNPITHPHRARFRRNVGLKRMFDTGRLTEKEYLEAKKTPITLAEKRPKNGCDASKFPFYCQWVLNTLRNDPTFGATPEIRAEKTRRGGLRVYTALDPAAEEAAVKAARKALGTTNRVATGIATVTPGTGHVPVLATNRVWGTNVKRNETQIIYPTIPGFQPGSNFKPITLATAVEQGFPLETVITTGATVCPANSNCPKRSNGSIGFRNDNNGPGGALTAAQATARSVNTFYVELAHRTGPVNIANMAQRLGVTSLPRKGPNAVTERDVAITLGAYEVAPIEMAGAYATFASGGIHCNPVGIITMTTLSGEPLPAPDPNCHRVISADTAGSVAQILRGAFKFGTARGLDLPNKRQVGGKTGTTDNSAATWFSGITADYATTIWVGDPRGGQAHPLKGVQAFGYWHSVVYGSTIAGPIWKDMMTTMHKNLPNKALPKPTAASGLKLSPALVNTVGMTVGDAVKVLRDAGHIVVVKKHTAKRKPGRTPGYVAKQTPAAGTLTGPGLTVKLTLSAGSNTNLIIPN